MRLFLNTDTTGFIKDREANDSPSQPYCTRLTLRMLDSDYTPLGLYDAITLPEGWSIPEDVVKINGISNELALSSGVRAGVSGVVFQDFMKQVDTVISFNLPFHKRVLEILFNRLNKPLSFDNKKLYCVSKLATSLVKLPPTQRMIDSGKGDEYKVPSLEEAYLHFFNKPKPLTMLSVDACSAIFNEIELKHGLDFLEEKKASPRNNQGKLRF